MFESLGATLRSAREARGWSIEDAERATRIRAKYLLALEAGEIDILPSPLQARGFLRSYAGHLGLSPEQAVAQMEEASKAAPRKGLAGLKPRIGAGSGAAASSSPLAWLRRVRRLFTLDVVIAVAIVGGMIAFFVWGGMRVAALLSGQAQLTQTPEVLGPTATLTSTPTIIANITATFTPPPPLVSFSNVQLQLVIEQRTFVRAYADGNLAFEGLLLPGDQKEIIGQRVVEVVTGNAAGVRIILNQRDLGTMGGFGEVAVQQFLPSGMVTVTPTITPTPTTTFTASPTSTETPSPTPSRTPLP